HGAPSASWNQGGKAGLSVPIVSVPSFTSVSSSGAHGSGSAAPVEIELENAGEHLKAEMFARVDLDLQTEREALLVPRDALVYRNDRQGVFIVDAMTARFQPVVTGLTDGDRVEILEGVTEQDTVVTRGANLLQNGDEIQILSPEGD
ncbi:MAG: efflux RND transporter periplasmic adaptor subunit, partial [Vicinamibacteria bacterium]